MGFDASAWMDTGACCENEKLKQSRKIYIRVARLMSWFYLSQAIQYVINSSVTGVVNYFYFLKNFIAPQNSPRFGKV
jgi:hypothetical protein